MTTNQPNISNLVNGIKNNIDPKLLQNLNNAVKQNYQNLTPSYNNLPININPSSQSLVSQPNLQQPQYMDQVANQLVQTNLANIGGSIDTTITFFGKTFQRKYVYIFGILLLIIIGYIMWKWYSKKNKPTQEEDDDDEDDVNYEQQQQMQQKNPNNGKYGMNQYGPIDNNSYRQPPNSQFKNKQINAQQPQQQPQAQAPPQVQIPQYSTAQNPIQNKNIQYDEPIEINQNN
ncbi:Hypothetical protein KVN_LOCUS231 [uncultured virus]|nr:Hypothetical protein KVN_LOCUS231 [uncultured virus]